MNIFCNNITIKISLIIVVASLSACRQAPPIPKEGDVVIWKQRPELIIKAKLGQRREHVIKDPRIEHRVYEPEYERFIGQFPIDYEPGDIRGQVFLFAFW